MSRIPTPPPRQREPRARDRKYLDSFRDTACEACGANDGTVVPAHMTIGWGRRSEKPHDYLVAGLCFACHGIADGGNWTERARLWLEVLRTLMRKRYEGGM